MCFVMKQKNLRIDDDIADAVAVYRHKEMLKSETQAYNRLIRAGLIAEAPYALKQSAPAQDASPSNRRRS